MELWYAYLDESYNTKTFCVGGFLARANVWEKITPAWSERIAYENRISAKKGFPPISRYHATDCANLKREFSEKNGWDVNRQIKLTKRICEILASHLTIGIVIGGSLVDIQRYLVPGSDTPADFLYSTCFKVCLMEIAGLMYHYVVDPQVKVFYERGKFNSYAIEAFEMLRKDPNPVYRSIVNVEPKGWEDCIPLQAADFFAYEGFQRVDGAFKGRDQIKRSLQALIRADNPLIVSCFTDENFADLIRMIENTQAGRPLGEGVESGLRGIHGSPPYIPG